ncbi:MAG: PEP-CTERM sorting domain-containing protein [Verrucomicrobia bacterium]|nr:PEP-CTERM sorting domain-containing protein [Verrucomicrobiota bacterium]MCH8511847.1 PEP-CTERM sorting domain-containing protein [Kiritimatiellia bacterium]
MKNQCTHLFVAALAGLFAIASAHGALIYEQNFNTLDDGNLNGQAGFTVASTNQTYTVASGGLSYAGGDVSHGGSGKQLNIVGGNSEIPTYVNFTEQTGDLYFSFLFRSTGTGTFLWVAASDDGDFNNSGGAIAGWLPADGGRNAVLGRLRDGSDQTNSLTAGPWDHDETYMVVGRLSKSDPVGNYNQFSVLLNPTSLTEPATWTDVTRDIGVSAVDTLVFRVGGSTSFAYSVDDFRVGTTYDAVVIPEPGTLLLLGIALGAMLLFRRRK